MLYKGFNTITYFQQVPRRKHSQRAGAFRYNQRDLFWWWAKPVKGGTLGRDIVHPKYNIPECIPRWVHSLYDYGRKQYYSRSKK